MNPEFESAARWYAAKVVMVLFSIIGAFVGIAYVGIFWLFVVVALMFVLMIAGALYRDAYYTKLVELEVEKYDQSRTN